MQIDAAVWLPSLFVRLRWWKTLRKNMSCINFVNPFALSRPVSMDHVRFLNYWCVESACGSRRGMICRRINGQYHATEWKGCGKTNLSKWIEQVFRTIINRSSAFLGTVDRASGMYLATYISRSPPNPCAWASASKMIARRTAWGSPGKKVKNLNVEQIISGITRKSSEISRPKAFRVFLSQ